MLRSSVLSFLYRSRIKAAGAGPIGGRDDARGELDAPKVTSGLAPSTYLREHRKRGVAAARRPAPAQPTRTHPSEAPSQSDRDPMRARPVCGMWVALMRRRDGVTRSEAAA